MTPDTGPQALRDTLRRDLTRAMKAREPDAVSALRTAIAAIDNAEAVPAPDETLATTSGHIAGARAGIGAAEAARRNLSPSEQQAILRDQVSAYNAEADRYAALGHPIEVVSGREEGRLICYARRTRTVPWA